MKKIVKTSVEIKTWFSNLNENIDVWVTDPPYPFNNQNGTGRHNHIGGKDNMYSRMTWDDMFVLYSNMFSVTNKGGRAYIFCNRDGLFKTKEMLDKIGWKFRNVLVWDKINMGMGYHWRNQVEYIIYVSKGKALKYVKNHSNVFSYKKPTSKDSIASIGYNLEGADSPKPHQIWSEIIDLGVDIGEVIADPFAGSDPMSAALKLDTKLMKKIKKAYVNSFHI